MFLKYALEPREYYKALSLVIVVDDPELDVAIALLDHCRLCRAMSVARGHGRPDTGKRRGDAYLFREGNSRDLDRFLLRFRGFVVLDALVGRWGSRVGRRLSLSICGEKRDQ